MFSSTAMVSKSISKSNSKSNSAFGAKSKAKAAAFALRAEVATNHQIHAASLRATATAQAKEVFVARTHLQLFLQKLTDVMNDAESKALLHRLYAEAAAESTQMGMGLELHAFAAPAATATCVDYDDDDACSDSDDEAPPPPPPAPPAPAAPPVETVPETAAAAAGAMADEARSRESSALAEREQGESTRQQARAAPVASEPAPRREAADAADDTLPSAFSADEVLPPVEDDRQLPPGAWLERIRERIRQGDRAGARASLQYFERAHPDLAVPSDLAAFRP